MQNAQVLMRDTEPNGCGRALLANAANITYDEASKVLPGQEAGTIKANMRDTMIHHKVAMWKLKLKHRIVTDDQIIARECQPYKTCILFHDLSNPTFSQHWCNYAGHDKNNNIIIWFNWPGDEIRVITPADLKKTYRLGSFNHAHEIGVGRRVKPAWWEFLIYWFTAKF